MEKEAHAHSRQSAIGPDGMVIPARAHKKRRLDEELEAILEAMEVRKKETLMPHDVSFRTSCIFLVVLTTPLDHLHLRT